MDVAELVELLTPEGLRLLDSLPRYDGMADVVRMVSDLRHAGHPPGLVAAVLTQSRLRTRAEAKFGEFARRMLFTEAGLEQATRLPVAALHADRYRTAGLSRVADLGCGIGGDALAMSAIGLEVTAVEHDEVTAAIAAYNLAPWESATVVHGDAAAADLAGSDGVYLDPARRTAGHQSTSRIADPDEFSPTLGFALRIASERPAGIKLGPGLDRQLIPPEMEAQWVSAGGEVVELGLWSGPLARQGVRRAALVLGEHGSAELTAEGDSADVETGPLGAVVYEPDGAVIRARLIGDLARRMDARLLSPGIAYLTADDAVATPFASCFRVLATLPLDERAIGRELASRDIGTVEIKKRGVDIDPAAFRRRLRPRGEGSGTLILTRIAGRHAALVVERVDQPL